METNYHKIQNEASNSIFCPTDWLLVIARWKRVTNVGSIGLLATVRSYNGGGQRPNARGQMPQSFLKISEIN